MRIASLDLGVKSMGICISDEMKVIAIPLENFTFEHGDLNKPISRVLKLIEEYNDIEEIIIGNPKKEDGTKANISDFIESFVEKLKLKTSIKIKYFDERYSTKRGVELLESKYKDKDKIKEMKDMAAAYIMLTDYLSSK